MQREFTVQYVYDYAYSTYTPTVSLPVQPREQAKLDTPEGAMIAMMSAVRTGDYDGWLKCWDDKSRAKFAEAAKQEHRDAAFMAQSWQKSFGKKDVLLIARIEGSAHHLLGQIDRGEPDFAPQPDLGLLDLLIEHEGGLLADAPRALLGERDEARLLHLGLLFDTVSNL